MTMALVVMDGSRGIVRRVHRIDACPRCRAHVSAGAPRRPNGAHVVCPPPRGARAVVLDFTVFAEPVPVTYRCGCADQRRVFTDCACAMVTECSGHGLVHHGTHD